MSQYLVPSAIDEPCPYGGSDADMIWWLVRTVRVAAHGVSLRAKVIVTTLTHLVAKNRIESLLGPTKAYLLWSPYACISISITKEGIMTLEALALGLGTEDLDTTRFFISLRAARESIDSFRITIEERRERCLRIATPAGQEPHCIYCNRTDRLFLSQLDKSAPRICVLLHTKTRWTKAEALACNSVVVCVSCNSSKKRLRYEEPVNFQQQ